MNEATILVVACAAGVLLGAFFFGGLWWTVRRGLSSRRPALWFFGSLLVRTGVVLGGFYLIASGDWQRLLPCLVGFVVAQLLATRLTRPTEKRQIRQTQEAGHAP
jgi:F1F0 ATPase subunit 2